MLSKDDLILFTFLSDKERLTFSQKRILGDILRDLEMWQINERHNSYDELLALWESLKTCNDYSNFIPSTYTSNFKTKYTTNLGMGRCPVASDNTRCCNLYTLDIIRNCNYKCNYCSIKVFKDENSIFRQEDLQKSLDNLKLDKNIIYHIGTGQASDSLLITNNEWKIITNFLLSNKNVIMEFKSKSAVSLTNIPSNLISTWTLNTPIIIKNEELGTATLNERIMAAKKVMGQGNLIGFHFHPLIYYKNWQKDYEEVIDKVIDTIDPNLVAMISMGTLTYTSKTIRQIRTLPNSKVLQMPLAKSGEKYSYPADLKLELFKFIYDKFRPWHKKVFFYLCMEETFLWPKVFNYSYSSNDELEKEMISFYWQKIKYVDIRK